MALPEPHLQTHRRLDDQTGGAKHFNACEYEGTWADGDSSVAGDAWVRDFVGRLAAQIRSLGGKN